MKNAQLKSDDKTCKEEVEDDGESGVALEEEEKGGGDGGMGAVEEEEVQVDIAGREEEVE